MGDVGAGTLEYSALVCVAAVLLAALLVPLHGRITPWVRWGLCVVFTGFTGGDCNSPEQAAKHRQKQEKPCIVDTRTTTGGGDLYLPLGGGLEGSNSKQRRSDGSLWVTMTLTGKIGVALGAEVEGVGVSLENDATGAISMKLKFKNKDMYQKFREGVHDREVDAISDHIPGHSTWLAEKALKYGKYIAAPLLIKIIYDAIMDTVHSMNVPNTVAVSAGFKASRGVTVAGASGTGTAAVATTGGKSSNGTSYRSYTIQLGVAGDYNIVPSNLFGEGSGVSLDEKFGVDVKGTFTVLVYFDKDGKATHAKAILRLQGDLTEAVGGGGKVSGKYVGGSGSLELKAKEGVVSVVTKKLTLDAAEKAVFTEHKDDIEPKRSVYYLGQIGKALYQNLGGKYLIRVYGHLEAGGKAQGKLSVLDIDVVQGSVSASAGREHLLGAYTYDPGDGGLQRDEQCAKAA